MRSALSSWYVAAFPEQNVKRLLDTVSFTQPLVTEAKTSFHDVKYIPVLGRREGRLIISVKRP